MGGQYPPLQLRLAPKELATHTCIHRQDDLRRWDINKTKLHWLRTPSADRTTSYRRAAGSRRNKRLRHIGHIGSWDSPLTYDWGLQPNHKERAVNIDDCFAAPMGHHH